MLTNSVNCVRKVCFLASGDILVPVIEARTLHAVV